MQKVKQLLPAAVMLLTMGLVHAQVKVYKGTSTYSGDVISTIHDHKVYTGNSTYSGDIEFTMDDFVTLVEFCVIWHAVRYSY